MLVVTEVKGLALAGQAAAEKDDEATAGMAILSWASKLARLARLALLDMAVVVLQVADGLSRRNRGGSIATFQLMVPPSKVTAEKKELLSSFIDNFLKAQKKNQLDKFWVTLYLE
ncbi:hypothetical protein BDN71DRAFT_1430350 [Pleurotus eryngii]|uniref:Uncharacterized protein n=1 Tax=Pleurotus eryngii TaxID=5323 RepID=A0A9P6D7U3_PLEER|nr:hypothetical protein BDN71DRAFT_1430350 [Pleurotus eryngii]